MKQCLLWAIKLFYPKATFFDIENLIGLGKKVDKVDYTKEFVCYIKGGDEEGIRKVVEHILKDYYYNQTEINIDLFKISLLSIIDGVMYALDLRENNVINNKLHFFNLQ